MKGWETCLQRWKWGKANKIDGHIENDESGRGRKRGEAPQLYLGVLTGLLSCPQAAILLS